MFSNEEIGARKSQGDYVPPAEKSAPHPSMPAAVILRQLSRQYCRTRGCVWSYTWLVLSSLHSALWLVSSVIACTPPQFCSGKTIQTHFYRTSLSLVDPINNANKKDMLFLEGSALTGGAGPGLNCENLKFVAIWI